MSGFRTRGQPAAQAAVERWIASDRPPHALLLVGPSGVGKITLALDLAAGLLCTAPTPAERPCRACPACRKVDHGNHPDLHRLAPDGAGGQVRLGQVQELQAELALLPMEGRYRVAIVEAAHRLNPDAQNALLKTLEEPPALVVIVLAADDGSLLLPTVHSRCARLRLLPLGPSAMAGLLAERGLADAPRAALLGRLSGGRAGLALSLAVDDDAQRAHGRLVRSLIDLLAAEPRTRLAAVPGLLSDAAQLAAATDQAGGTAATNDAPPDSSPAPRPQASRRAPERGSPAPARSRPPAPAERRRALLQLLDTWRDLGRDLAVASRGGRTGLRQVELLEELGSAGERLDPAALDAFLARVDSLAGAVEAYANPELALDVLLLQWPRLADLALDQPGSPRQDAA